MMRYLLNDVLQKGIKQVAAGYFLYGSSTMMVYTTGNGTGVHGFTLFPSVGEFLLSHENIRTPSKGKIYSINEGNFPFWDEKVKTLVEYYKVKERKTSRYVGSLVADFHRNMLKGGIFLYPADKKDPKKPSGKLRLMVEANPLALVARRPEDTPPMAMGLFWILSRGPCTKGPRSLLGAGKMWNWPRVISAAE